MIHVVALSIFFAVVSLMILAHKANREQWAYDLLVLLGRSAIFLVLMVTSYGVAAVILS